MELIEHTFQQAEKNLAVDEYLLNDCEESPGHEYLRLWNPVDWMVVIGRSTRSSLEVDLDFCRANAIPVFRRISGGTSIVTGQGCLMYAVILDYRQRPELRSLDQAHQFVMQKMQSAISSLGVQVEFQGTCDLTLNNRKFSGNSMKSLRNSMLYHGTFLCTFSIEKIEQCLLSPERQPEYRQQRSHADFLTNLDVDESVLRNAIIEEWGGTKSDRNWAMTNLDTLCREKYLNDKWNFRI